MLSIKMEKFKLQIVTLSLFIANFQLCLSEPCPYNKETTLSLHKLGARYSLNMLTHSKLNKHMLHSHHPFL